MAKASMLTRLNSWMEARLETVALRPRYAAYFIASFWAIAVILFGVVERIVDPKTFPSVWLGLWWAVETVTTVGYGDVVPQQTLGKAIAAVLMIGGLSFIAVLTAAVTSGFVSRAQAGKDNPVVQKLDALGEELQSVRAELEGIRSGMNAGRSE